MTVRDINELEEIIMRRWNAMTSPLHCAALFLGPEYRASRPETDAKVADGFWTWLYSWRKESSFVEVDAEVCCWIEGIGGHNCEDARTQARLMQPARWWRKWCSDMPILQSKPFVCLDKRPPPLVARGTGACSNEFIIANKGSPQWEEDEPVENLTRDEMAKDARMRLAEWRARLHRTESVSDAGGEEAHDVEGGSLAEGPAPSRLTRKRGRPQKQPVQEEEEVAPEGTSSDESGGGADENDGGSDESDGSGDGDDGSGDGDDGSGGCDGTDGSGKEDEGEGDEKDGCSSEEEGDSESEPLRIEDLIKQGRIALDLYVAEDFEKMEQERKKRKEEEKGKVELQLSVEMMEENARQLENTLREERRKIVEFRRMQKAQEEEE
ncbi:hypothetical protein CBR_g49039 [Chara braunii]|uniref:Uncharacterized protein n=1 Tax=Chara braunii TaxID=69332 RepID=A0A388M4E5_CHABU|nr:hypothetical protein CBR_g49039 [Chara braunii]|eukprot:GBG89329.1 hypothetical protein CBR_g49039 [Chara braunii]